MPVAVSGSTDHEGDPGRKIQAVHTSGKSAKSAGVSPRSFPEIGGFVSPPWPKGRDRLEIESHPSRKLPRRSEAGSRGRAGPRRLLGGEAGPNIASSRAGPAPELDGAACCAAVHASRRGAAADTRKGGPPASTPASPPASDRQQLHEVAKASFEPGCRSTHSMVTRSPNPHGWGAISWATTSAGNPLRASGVEAQPRPPARRGFSRYVIGAQGLHRAPPRSRGREACRAWSPGYGRP